MNIDGSDVVKIAAVIPLAKPVAIATQAVIDSGVAVLSRICNPLLEAVGDDLAGMYRGWRGANGANVALKAEQLMIQTGNKGYVHPRILFDIVESSSLCDDEELQNVWAGLICSSCTDDGRDDSAIPYISLLNQLSSSQVKILNRLCERSEKFTDNYGKKHSCYPVNNTTDLRHLVDNHDIPEITDDIAHLSALRLIDSRLHDTVDAAVWTLDRGLNLYLRCHGVRQRAENFWAFPLNPDRKRRPVPMVS